MRKISDSMVWAASLVLVVSLLAAARADEPKCECPQRGVPILAKIPYVSRLFKNVGVAPRAGMHCDGMHCREMRCDRMPGCCDLSAGGLRGCLGADRHRL